MNLSRILSFLWEKKFIISLLLIALLSRLIPHLPNATAMSFVSLLLGLYLPRRYAVSLILLVLFISDMLLAMLVHYPFIGYWMFFTYSGFLFITLASSFTFIRQSAFQNNFKLVAYFIGSSLFYWIWTNLGVFLCSDLYTHSPAGLTMCYFMGLPFLRNQLINDIIWVVLWFGLSFTLNSTLVNPRLQSRIP